MTREQAKKILGENATDEQITSLLNSYHSEMGEKEDTIKSLTEKLTNSQSKVTELTGYAEELKKIKESQMTEQEKFQQLQKDYANKMSEANKLVNSTKAKSVLIGAGISSDRAEQLVGKFVKEDEQATLDLANDFVNELNLVKEATKKQVTESLSSLDLRPAGSNVQPNTNKTMTWENYQALSATEQAKFAEEHPDEFNAL